jgi:predicted nucleic acid-binding Zn ribbon protein
MYSKTYKCDSCGVTLTVGVPLVQNPVHKCPKKANRMRELNEITTGNSERGQDTSTESD